MSFRTLIRANITLSSQCIQMVQLQNNLLQVRLFRKSAKSKKLKIMTLMIRRFQRNLRSTRIAWLLYHHRRARNALASFPDQWDKLKPSCTGRRGMSWVRIHFWRITGGCLKMSQCIDRFLNHWTYAFSHDLNVIRSYNFAQCLRALISDVLFTCTDLDAGSPETRETPLRLPVESKAKAVSIGKTSLAKPMPRRVESSDSKIDFNCCPTFMRAQPRANSLHSPEPGRSVLLSTQWSHSPSSEDVGCRWDPLDQRVSRNRGLHHLPASSEVGDRLSAEGRHRKWYWR